MGAGQHQNICKTYCLLTLPPARTHPTLGSTKETNVQTSLVYSSPPPWTSPPSHQIRTQESPVFTSTLEAPGLSEMQKSAHLAHSEFNWTDHSLKQFSPILQRMDPIHLLSLRDLSTPQSFRGSWIPFTENNEVSLLNSLIRTLPSDLNI